MKKFVKKALAIILACILAFSAVTCFAAENKKYYDYGKYVLLGVTMTLFISTANLSALRVHTAQLLPILSVRSLYRWLARDSGR